MTDKPRTLSSDLISTIDRFIAQLQIDRGANSSTKIAVLEDLRHELRANGTIPFSLGDPGASVLWDLIEQDRTRPSE